MNMTGRLVRRVFLPLCALAVLANAVYAQDKMPTTDADEFQFTKLLAASQFQAPGPLSQGPSAVDLSNVDVDALAKYDAALKSDKSDLPPSEKARIWKELANASPKLASLAAKRADEWNQYATQTQAANAILQNPKAARDADWAKVFKLFSLSVVSDADKMRYADEFVRAYYKSPGLDYGMAWDVAAYLPKGPQRKELATFAQKAPTEYFQSLTQQRRWRWTASPVFGEDRYRIGGPYGILGEGHPMVAFKMAEILSQNNWVFDPNVGDAHCVGPQEEGGRGGTPIGCGNGYEGALQAALKTVGKNLNYPFEANGAKAFFKGLLKR